MTLDANWTSSEGEGKLTRQAFNQVRSMCEERTLGADRTMPANINADLIKDERVRASHRLSIHNEVTALIPLYVNQTVSGGEYSGLDEIPTWTEADILTAIGDASRLPSPNDHINCADWNWQTVQILNLLIWHLYDMPNSDVREYFKTSTGQVNYNDAITSFNNASWGEIFTNIGNVYCGNYYASAYFIEARQARSTIQPIPGIQCSMDVYLFPRKSFQTYFEGLDGATIQDKMNKIKTVAEFSVATSFSTYEDADMPVLNPAIPGVETYGTRAGITGKNIVKKFDGPNGFQYTLP